MTKKTTSITYTNLKKILLESLFDPRKPIGTIKIIMEVNDPNYYEMRAIEMIGEAKSILHTPFGSINDYNERITKAISLLGLAKLIRHNNTPKE